MHRRVGWKYLHGASSERWQRKMAANWTPFWDPLENERMHPKGLARNKFKFKFKLGARPLSYVYSPPSKHPLSALHYVVLLYETVG